MQKNLRKIMAHCPLEILKKAENFEETTPPAIDNDLLSYNLWLKRHFPRPWKGRSVNFRYKKKLSF